MINEQIIKKAIELLGERHQDYDFNGISFVQCLTDYEQGSNQMHSKAVGVVERLLAKISELEEEARRIRLGMCDDYGDDPIGVIDTFKKELQSLSKENEVLREQNLDAVKDYKELQSLKSKLSRENLENVIDTEGLGIHFEEMGNSIGVYQALRKQLVQAIQKACGINDGGGE